MGIESFIGIAFDFDDKKVVAIMIDGILRFVSAIKIKSNWKILLKNT
jgi:hypothetical protein